MENDVNRGCSSRAADRQRLAIRRRDAREKPLTNGLMEEARAVLEDFGPRGVSGVRATPQQSMNNTTLTYVVLTWQQQDNGPASLLSWWERGQRNASIHVHGLLCCRQM
eukprot:364666-Chlamydomonas_euryale.AAC.6